MEPFSAGSQSWGGLEEGGGVACLEAEEWRDGSGRGHYAPGLSGSNKQATSSAILPFKFLTIPLTMG